jgi:DNA-binding transcriptional ArsR family regulator
MSNSEIKDTPINPIGIEVPKEKIFPSYYSVLTAKVRYDKEIPMGAKVCFSEITALTNRSGFCYASNKYFAGLYDVSETTISTWIKRLQERGHVTASYLHGQRKIYIPEQTIKAGAFPKQHPSAKTEKQEFREAEMKEKMRHEKQRQAQKEYEESLGEPATAEEVRQIMAEARARIGG